MPTHLSGTLELSKRPTSIANIYAALALATIAIKISEANTSSVAHINKRVSHE